MKSSWLWGEGDGSFRAAGGFDKGFFDFSLSLLSILGLVFLF